MKNIVFAAIAIVTFSCNVQEHKHTAVSLFMKSDSTQVVEVSSEQADLFTVIGHHGPAVENEYYALRFYFNNSGSIDVYSKSKQQLELEETIWYPDSLMQTQGYGSDQYKVGPTVGLGGIKLWDGEKVLNLVATKGRIARVENNDSSSSMELIAKGIAYMNDTVDIMMKVTVWSGNRMAKVEAFSLTDKEVHFVTGINHHVGHKVKNETNYALSWGIHPEDVAINPGIIGGAIIYDETLLDTTIEQENQLLFISKPLKYISTQITTVSEHDIELNTLSVFEDFVKKQID